MIASTTSSRRTAEHLDTLRFLERAINYRRAAMARRAVVLSGGNANIHAFLKPRMDLFDDPTSAMVVATLELPGLRKEEVILRFQENNLIVSGCRRPRLPGRPQSSGQPTLSTPTQPQNSREENSMVPPQDPESTHSRVATRYAVQELRYGQFRRAIPLPNGVLPSNISASMGDGMLTVTWPRAPVSTDAAPGTEEAHHSNTAASTSTSSTRSDLPVLPSESVKHEAESIMDTN